ncbi:MAG: YihA family ribosome biogenesis GTP-binding protein [Opitutaceae bacterium]|nr:YihA family ribosome biogenesis GTP-binding protein [Opitutaceae bacterium]MBP9911988.1 YihA family ribosome biogenesis GTP-binding protein [Opitutaceae bacterium]
MKIKSAAFALSAPDLPSCPKSALPEFAFIGRSNVGKSSLINLLAERRDLAKVSDLPGKTKLINFFTMNNTWSLVDLPGYGYANVSKRESVAFNKAVCDYLEMRRNVYRVFALIDSRLPPQRVDLEFVQWLGEVATPFVLVFTKTDKQSAAQTQANIELFKKEMNAWTSEMPQVFTCSAKTKQGRTEILNHIEQIIKKNSRE